MIQRTIVQTVFVAAMALIAMGISAYALADVPSEDTEKTVVYFYELLALGSIAGLLLLLDMTSWSWMTSRR